MTHVLTVVANRAAASLSPGVLTALRDAASGGTPVVLSDGEAVDIPLLRLPDMAQARAALGGQPIDLIALPAVGRRKAVLLADMDSTIVTGETLDELAALAGIGERIAAITTRAMNGELDFKQALRERVAMLKGLPLDALERAWARVALTSGARELVATMRAGGARTALVSGGFSFFTSRVAATVGFEVHRSNQLLDDGTSLTGSGGRTDPGPRCQARGAEREIARERGVELAATLAVGDGANDLDMLRAAGLGVAFRAKPIVAAEARVRVDHADLRALLFAQGYRASRIRDGLSRRVPG